MPVILSMKDRIKLKLGKVEFLLKPLTVFEIGEIQAHRTMVEGVEVQDMLKSSFAYLKYAVKGLSGVKDGSGEDYRLEFDANNEYLTDDCVNELFTLKLGADFYHAIEPLKNNQIDKKPTNLITKKPIRGAKLEVIRRGEVKK